MALGGTFYAVFLTADDVPWWWFVLAGLAVMIGLAILIRDMAQSRRARSGPPSWDEMNKLRIGQYQEQQGLFLVHTWTPSYAEGQVANVTVHLTQHARGPLTAGTVEAVEYTFGPQFEEHSIVIRDPTNGFQYETSMYGPMLCLAKVYFSDDRHPMLLDRYINFDDPGQDS
jgi:hypothetical protein